MIFLAKLGVGVMGTALIGAAALSSEGFIHVKVHENRVGGTRVNLIVPAALVPAALKFVPDHHLVKASNSCVRICQSLTPPFPLSRPLPTESWSR